MGILTGHRVSSEADTTQIPNIPYSGHIPTSECMFEIFSGGDPGTHRYIIQWMLQTFCEFSSDFPSLLRSLSDPVVLSNSGKIIQFPFSRPTVDEKTEEEQARLAERRKEQGKRLQEMAAKSRMEKVSTSSMISDHVQRGYFSWKPKRRICVRCWS